MNNPTEELLWYYTNEGNSTHRTTSLREVRRDLQAGKADPAVLLSLLDSLEEIIEAQANELDDQQQEGRP